MCKFVHGLHSINWSTGQWLLTFWIGKLEGNGYARKLTKTNIYITKIKKKGTYSSIGERLKWEYVTLYTHLHHTFEILLTLFIKLQQSGLSKMLTNVLISFFVTTNAWFIKLWLTTRSRMGRRISKIFFLIKMYLHTILASHRSLLFNILFQVFNRGIYDDFNLPSYEAVNSGFFRKL
jgi:hypothetical protein